MYHYSILRMLCNYFQIFLIVKRVNKLSKFVGKFRKNQDYSDDYNAMKSSGKKVKKRNEHGEIRKLLTREMQEGYEYYDNYEDLK